MKAVIKQFDDRMQAQIGLMGQLNEHTNKQIGILEDQDKLMKHQLEVVEKQIRLDQAIKAQKPDLTFKVFKDDFSSSRTEASKKGIPLMFVIENKGTREATDVLFNFWIPSSAVITSIDGNLKKKAEIADAVIDGVSYRVIRGHETGPIFSLGEGTKVGTVTILAPPDCYVFRWKLTTTNIRFPAGESFEKLMVPLGARCS